MKSNTIDLNKEIKLDQQKLFSTMSLLQASTGGGKSWTIRRILEQSFGKIPQLILDTEGEFSTLREKYDYVLIGKGHEVAADVKTAGRMALELWKAGASAIIDLYEMTPWDRQVFVKNFLDAMINAPKNLWSPVLLVIDEAHEYAPEGDRTECARSMHLLASKGRKREIGVLFATQRIASLSKNVIAACKNKLIGYTSLDIDMKRANDTLGFSTKDLALRKLEEGEFYGFGPAFGRETIKFKVGNILTTHGNHGKKAARVYPPTKKVKEWLIKLSTLPAEVAKEASTIAELKKELIDERKKNSLLAKNNKDSDKIKELENIILKKDKLLEESENKYKLVLHKIVDLINPHILIRANLHGMFKDAKVIDLDKVNKFRMDDLNNPKTVIPAKLNFPLEPPKKSESKKVDVLLSGQKIGMPEQKILDAIGWFDAIGIADPSIIAVASIAQYSANGGSFKNSRGKLRTMGLVEYLAEGKITLTEAGKQHAHTPNEPLTRHTMHERVLSVLGMPEQKILQPLLEAYPAPLSFEDLASQAGYEASGGSFKNSRGKLNTMRFIRYSGKGRAVAAEFLFSI